VSSPTPVVVKYRKKPLFEEESSDLFPFFESEILCPVKGDDFIEFSRPGIQHKILRKMRKGQYTIEATLDMHGMTVLEAQQALSRFMRDCHYKGICHVLMIHGKGRSHHHPALKNQLNHWLRQSLDVLAFCSAQVKNGSTGALYVLLRRSRS
jgi:DNA-nicking Smr family endonuclease